MEVMEVMELKKETKKTYICPEIDIILFGIGDVITTSPDSHDDPNTNLDDYPII